MEVKNSSLGSKRQGMEVGNYHLFGSVHDVRREFALYPKPA
jgi:hypothetical protein